MLPRRRKKRRPTGFRRSLPEHLEARCLLATLDIAAVADNTLFEDLAGNISNGAGEHVFVGRNRQGNIRRGLFQFDVAGSLPAGATVSSASLRLHVSQSRPGSDTISLHRVLASWGEGDSDATGSEGLGAEARPGDATWLDRTFGTALWENAGGDFSLTSSAGTSVGGAGDYTWSSPQMVRDVQGWFDNPNSNFGWLLMGNEQADQSAVRLDSRENATIDFRPVLTVNFTSDNKAPTDINLSAASISESADVSQPVVIGTLSAVDEDTDDSHTFALINGPGAADNGLFQIVDNELQLRANAALDHEAKATLGIGVSAKDAAGDSTVKSFTIAVADANEPPVVSAPLSDIYLVGETDFTVTIHPGTFSDPDDGDVLTLSAQLDNGSPLPAWLNFDPSTAAFSGQPSDGDATVIDVRVTASDTGQPSLQASDTISVVLTKSTAPWQSPVDPLDVAPDGFVVPRDVLILINELNAQQHSGNDRKLIGLPGPGVGLFDVTGDGFATPLDALQIVNFLNDEVADGESVVFVIDRPHLEQDAAQASSSEQPSTALPPLLLNPLPAQAAVSTQSRVPLSLPEDLPLQAALDELFVALDPLDR